MGKLDPIPDPIPATILAGDGVDAGMTGEATTGDGEGGMIGGPRGSWSVLNGIEGTGENRLRCASLVGGGGREIASPFSTCTDRIPSLCRLESPRWASSRRRAAASGGMLNVTRTLFHGSTLDRFTVSSSETEKGIRKKYSITDEHLVCYTN